MEVFTMDADTGANQENLTKNPARDYNPSWSPDGVTISFTTSRDGDAEIYMMDSHGGNPYNLSRNPATGDFGAKYAPDPYPDYANRGFTRALPTPDGGYNYEIYEMSYLGLYQTNLTNSPATDQDPTYSPDGTKIAFTTDRSGNEDIYKMSRDGTSPVQLTNNAADDFNADWAKKASS
jgi:Tol biopolymer transport system component